MKDTIVNLKIPVEFLKDPTLLSNLSTIKKSCIKETLTFLNKLGDKDTNYIVICTPFDLQPNDDTKVIQDETAFTNAINKLKNKDTKIHSKPLGA